MANKDMNVDMINNDNSVTNNNNNNNNNINMNNNNNNNNHHNIMNNNNINNSIQNINNNNGGNNSCSIAIALTTQASRSIQIVRPPAIMPPTPTSSPNTHEWTFSANFLPTFPMPLRERFGLPFLPPLPHMSSSLYSITMPSSSTSTSSSTSSSSTSTNTTTTISQTIERAFLHPNTQKMRIGSRSKFRLSLDRTHWKSESMARKLRIAATTCNIELLKRLLDAGADPNAADEFKRSPLHLAACRGYVSIVEELLKHDANPNVVDTLGNTPLHLAVISASSNDFNTVVRILLQAGAFVHMYDRSNQTPMELAEAKLRMLRSRYSNPTPETAQILEDMCRLTALIMRYMLKQQKELDDLSALEQRLQNLSTSDKQDKEGVVSQTADELLASLERLSLNK